MCHRVGMALRHIVLGLLADRPDHGYGIKQRISPGLPREELINDGVLYPLLRQMEEGGLIRGREEQARGRRRRVFSATAAGRREFRRWLRSDADEGDAPGYLLYAQHPLVKLLFAAHLSPAEVEAKIAAQQARVEHRLAAVEALARLAPPDPGSLTAELLALERSELRARRRALRRLAERASAPA